MDAGQITYGNEVNFMCSKLITPGEMAPDFELLDIHDRRVHLADYRGKSVVLAFLRGFL